MLTHQQILHFATFGYVTLRGLLSQAEAAALRQEVTGALGDAFGPNRRPRRPGRHQRRLPAACRRPGAVQPVTHCR